MARGRLRRWPGWGCYCQLGSMDVYGLLCGEYGLDSADEQCATPREGAPVTETKGFFLPQQPRGGTENAKGVPP